MELFSTGPTKVLEDKLSTLGLGVHLRSFWVVSIHTLAQMNKMPPEASFRSLVVLVAIIAADFMDAQTTWRRTYGGFDADELTSVHQTNDGGFIALGSTGSFGQGGDMYLVRLSESGTLLWSTSLGGESAQVGVTCQVVSDGYMIAGSTANGSNGGYDFSLIKVSEVGDVIWAKSIGTSGWDLCNDLVEYANGFLLVGISYGDEAISGDAFIIRTDEYGDVVWQQHIGGSGKDEALGVTIDPQGDILVVGRLDIDEGSEDGFIAKLTADGSVLWVERVGGEGPDYVSGTAISPDGDYVLVGGTRSYAEVLQVMISKYSVDGDMMWQRIYGSGGDTRMRRIITTGEIGYSMIGYNSAFNAGGRDMFMIRVDANGDFILGKNYGGIGNEEGFGICLNDDNGFTLVGHTDHYGPGVRAAYVIRCALNGETGDDTVYPVLDPLSIVELSQGYDQVRLYPNPSNGQFRIDHRTHVSSIRIWNTNGALVHEQTGILNEMVLDTGLPSGVYSVELITIENVHLRGRIIVITP